MTTTQHQNAPPLPADAPPADVSLPLAAVPPTAPPDTLPAPAPALQRMTVTTTLTVWRVMAYTAAVLVVIALANVLLHVRDVLILGLIGILLATAINPVARRLQLAGLGRTPSIICVYLFILIGVGLFVGFVIPPVVAQASEFVVNVPKLVNTLRTQYKQSDNLWLQGISEQIDAFYAAPPTNIFEILRTGVLGALSGVFGSFLAVVTVVLISFYWLAERNLIRRSLLGFVPDANRTRVGDIWDHIEGKLGAWFRAQLILCTIVGVVCAVFYGALDIRYWPLLAFIAGIAEIIPIIGPWIGGVPAVFIALLNGPGHAIAVAVFLVIFQQIEANVLVPRIQGDAVGLSPLTVILAILAGASLAGPVGGLLAVPISAIIQVLIQDLVVARSTPESETLPPALRRGSRRAARGQSPVPPDAPPTPGVLRQMRDAVHPPRVESDVRAGESD